MIADLRKSLPLSLLIFCSIAEVISSELIDYYKPSKLKKSAEDELCEWLANRCPYLNSVRGRPIENQSEPVSIDIEFHAKRLMQLNDLEQKMSVQGAFAIYWYIPACSVWNEAKLPNTLSLSKEARKVMHCTFSKSQIWHPHIYVANSIQNVATQIDSYSDDVITVFSNGKARMYSPGRYEVFCDLNFRTFPFDTQICYIELSTLSQRSSEVNFARFCLSLADNPGLKFVSDTDVWRLANFSYHMPNEVLNIVQFKFVFKRKPNHIIMSIIVPLLLLTALQVTALIIPPTMPERSGFSITAVLAFQVATALFSANIPQSSGPIYLFYYILGHMAVGITVSIYSLISCALTNCENFTRESTLLPGVSTIRFIDTVVLLMSIIVVFVINVTFFIGVNR